MFFGDKSENRHFAKPQIDILIDICCYKFSCNIQDLILQLNLQSPQEQMTLKGGLAGTAKQLYNNETCRHDLTSIRFQGNKNISS